MGVSGAAPMAIAATMSFLVKAASSHSLGNVSTKRNPTEKYIMHVCGGDGGGVACGDALGDWFP